MPYTRRDFDGPLLDFWLFLKLWPLVGWGPGARIPTRPALSAALCVCCMYGSG